MTAGPYHRSTDELPGDPTSRCCRRATLIARDVLEWPASETPTLANRMPTAPSYLRSPGDTIFRAFKFDVLRVVDGRIAEITTFGAALFPQFGLAPTLGLGHLGGAGPARPHRG